MACALIAAGCASQTPVYYSSAGNRVIVRPGDTIYGIAHQYGVSMASLMSVNGITDPRKLQVGQSLIIPAPGVRYYSAPQSSFASAAAPPPPQVHRQFIWPVANGVIAAPFGIRNGVMHDGVDIAAPQGTPVRAAAGGVVMYSGRVDGFGNVVILKHSEGYTTVYAHNERNLVSEGERVVRGQEIAEVGSTGRVRRPNLHFEVRYDNLAQNPLEFLPNPASTDSIRFAQNSGS